MKRSAVKRRIAGLRYVATRTGCFLRIEEKNPKRINKMASIQYRGFAPLRIAGDLFRRSATAIWFAQKQNPENPGS
jgi:hypothetical protein